jgi:hypothetical protein
VPASHLRRVERLDQHHLRLVLEHQPVGRHARCPQQPQALVAVSRVAGSKDGFVAGELCQLSLVDRGAVRLVRVQPGGHDAVRLFGGVWWKG